jgi:GNAT superfamily N-acetyltransferase
MQYQIKKLDTVEQMLPSLPIIVQLSPDLKADDYAKMLAEMVPHNYRQVGVYDNEKLIGVSGYWIASKLYCGKYLEIDNFVIDKEYRSKNIGKMMVEWMSGEARRNGCRSMLLDAYVENFKAHKFYYSQGFIARGFHYLKWL